jgi:hypothetical protein
MRNRFRTAKSRFPAKTLAFLAAMLGPALLVGVLASPTVPTDIEQPGTQPNEVMAFSSSCNCHYDTDNPQYEPGFGWEGSMMGNASRDPIFWATVAIAEQDFLPNPDPTLRGGAGDLCIRCHSVGGWFAGNSTPTDGSGLAADEDRGVECEFCHLLTNPDEPTNVPGTVEEQNAPFLAYDPDDGEPFRGTGQAVLNSEGTRLGPFGDAAANHAFYQSPFHRQAEMCGTCHDVSNPAVGDLAHNNGAMVPLDPGEFSGVPGSPVTGKAAFLNPPYAYGIVERTTSEHASSNWPTFLVNDFPSLPADLKVVGGALDIAYHRAWDARLEANYEDGTPRYYTCQTCHMYASTGKGCDKNQAPVRTDLPRHDHMGGGYWMPDVIQYQDNEGTLRFGGGLTADQITAMADAKLRAQAQLTRAANVTLSQNGNQLAVRVTNLTGHKFISGYPEGRRAWINIQWFDGGGQPMVADEIGAYGQIGRTAQDLNSVIHQVESIIDPDNTVVYEAEPGMDQEWANQLLSLGYDPNMVLTYDRMTDQPDETLQDLANKDPGESEHTFHFVLNNVMTHDNRIPPYGLRYDDALARSAMPVPYNQYGGAPGGTFNYWDENNFAIPPGAASAEVRLYYQQTSWEYIQFLWLNNDTLGPFLGQEGVNMLDAWLNTGQNAPFEMDSASISLSAATGTPGEADSLLASYNVGTGEVDLSYVAACDATNHTIYYGDLADVGNPTPYSAAMCSIGTSGTASFDPGFPNAFFLVVGNDTVDEGSYGLATAGERPAETGAICPYTQDLAGVLCE